MELIVGEGYYEPSEEELFIGFECEYTNLNRSEHLWTKIIWYPEFWGDVKNAQIGVRVKYLDKEDIESLGFKDHEFKGTKCFIKDGKGKSILLWHTLPGSMVSIDIKVGESARELLEIFRGSIKNKSELVKLLKQLGVNG